MPTPKSSPKPKKNGPDPERLKIPGDPGEQFLKLLKPIPKPSAKKPRKKSK